MNYYELREMALKGATEGNLSVTYAILALADQVQGLRRDMSGDDDA